MLSKSLLEMPGPANYDNDCDFKAFGKSGIAASIRGTLNNFKPSNYPGPGAYDQSNHATKDKSAAFKIGSSRR